MKIAIRQLPFIYSDKKKKLTKLVKVAKMNQVLKRGLK